MWCKQADTELVARVPLIVKVPWLTQSLGTSVTRLVELVDVFPTLLDLHGISIPDRGALEGSSFAPLLTDGPASPRWKKRYAFTQYPRCDAGNGMNNPCTQVSDHNLSVMGYSARSADARYTRWMKWNGSSLAVQSWDGAALVGESFYDHSTDDGNSTDFAGEDVNLAGQPQHAVKQAELTSALKSYVIKTDDTTLAPPLGFNS